jgi:hypothetical protein
MGRPYASGTPLGTADIGPKLVCRRGTRRRRGPFTTTRNARQSDAERLREIRSELFNRSAAVVWGCGGTTKGITTDPSIRSRNGPRNSARSDYVHSARKTNETVYAPTLSEH